MTFDSKVNSQADTFARVRGNTLEKFRDSYKVLIDQEYVNKETEKAWNLAKDKI